MKQTTEERRYGLMIAFGWICTTFGMFEVLGAFVAPAGRMECAVDSGIFLAVGTLLILRKRIAFPLFLLAAAPALIAAMHHGFYIGHVLWIAAVFAMMAYLRKRRNLLS
jgi:hypothetical protein